MNASADTQVLVVGGGQAGLAAGFYLRRLGLDFVILDAQPQPGGAWPHAWDSLALFSPAAYSSLPGKRMPPQPGALYPDAAHVVEYLTEYEKHYNLPVQRLARVHAVHRDDSVLSAETDAGTWTARAVIGATGTWWSPFLPAVPGREAFRGRQLHTVGYRTAREFAGEHVVVVGGGNSAAQIAADLALTGHATVTWATRRPPRFLPDEIDGRALFDIATTRRKALHAGETDTAGVAGIGDIVAVAPVREARDSAKLAARPMFTRLAATGPVWPDGTQTHADTIIWCTGFRPALPWLAPLHLRDHQVTIQTQGTRAVAEPRLHLIGYGDWTGPGSATLAGVGPTARDAAREIAALLAEE